MFGYRWGGFFASGVAGLVHLAVTRSLRVWSRLATPKAGLMGFVLVTVTAGAAGSDGLQAADADHHWMACNASVTLPRTVSIGAAVDITLVRSAIAEWDAVFGEVFVEVVVEVFIEVPGAQPVPADIELVQDSATWVEMPCRATHSVVHLGGQTNLSYWLTHELGHTLGLADHIRPIDDAARYVNPGHCPEDGYDGVMSYCTPRERWFGAEDRRMMRALFPRLAGPNAEGGTSGAGPVADPRIGVTIPRPLRDFP